MNPQQQPPSAMDPKQQVAQQLKSANNILVTVSTNPSVDQLAAATGTTLVLNKLGKHATAVFSGRPPSTIEFLQPQKTFEKNTDSLRDFIIALDKSKADKLRYKVEDKFVKIFITPYHTSLSEKDLDFSQGDFNIDLVLALGVKKKEDLDSAIVAHGRILHDATVISVNTKPGADIGAVNLNVPQASSLSEIMVGLCDLIKDEQKSLYDQQIATAFLTGVVAETNRFSNAKTTPQTMSTAAKLMNAGANQQLIATKLEELKPAPKQAPIQPAQPVQNVPKAVIAPPQPPPKPMQPVAAPPADGAMKIEHENKPQFTLPDAEAGDEDEADSIDRIHIDDDGKLRRLAELEAEKAKLTKGLTTSDSSVAVTAAPKPSETNPATNSQTLEAIEKQVDSPHTDEKISDVKTGGKLGVDYPEQVVGADKGLPADQTAGEQQPGGPPPIPPPIPLATPPPDDSVSGPGSGVPL